jgi:hypothetical protein
MAARIEGALPPPNRRSATMARRTKTERAAQASTAISFEVDVGLEGFARPFAGPTRRVPKGRVDERAVSQGYFPCACTKDTAACG